MAYHNISGNFQPFCDTCGKFHWVGDGVGSSPSSPREITVNVRGARELRAEGRGLMGVYVVLAIISAAYLPHEAQFITVICVGVIALLKFGDWCLSDK